MEENEHTVRINRGGRFRGGILVGHRLKKKEVTGSSSEFPVRSSEAIFILIERGPEETVPIRLDIDDDVDVLFCKGFLNSDEFSGLGWQLSVKNEITGRNRPKEINVNVGEPVIFPDQPG